MLTKLSVKETSTMQSEYAKKAYKLICGAACRLSCAGGDTYVVVFTANLNDEVTMGC
ncbi:MAG: hypothetical protein L0Y73_01690 [Candidatus Aminicenantes bacterium]|nr:hypothetical protein [Candidatus Aminicenantes bacterium]